ncbi:MAG: hypothetical protein M0Q38_16385 [Bacteroidales bacterium]|jgi:hypothetical protein|nr:hypothetical protein [Bacteroidales bacterium]
MKKILFIILSFALFTACERKIDEFQVSKGNADFTRYIAVGNSMMAGYADGALYKTGQSYSIPNIIANQLQLAGSGKFVQPVVNSEFGVEFNGSGPRFVLGPSVACDGSVSLGPIPYIGARDPLQPVGYPVNNLGIPGAKSFHLFAPGYGNPAFLIPPVHANPYYFRFCSEPTNPNFMVIDEFPKLNPTFFTEWLGDNDVLSYAISGGVGDSITSPDFFGHVMSGVLQALTANGAKGVIANIPDITSIPFFTTIPYNGIVLTRQTLVDSVNYFMQNLFQLPFIYKLGPNPFLVADPTSTHPLFKVRMMKPGELVLLSVPQDSLKCYGMGIISRITYTPWGIPSQYVLTEDEINNIKEATVSYNQLIKGLADAYEIGMVDMNSKLVELQKGIIWDGVSMNTKFVTGGAFSLDGIHLNPRGCAVAANYFIDAINKQYGSTIPQVDITAYPGVIYP